MCASKAPIILVGGPTASGKSSLAVALAEEFRGTVINADSMQVYRDLSVLTARPGAAEEARAPHRLFGVLDAVETCSAARWCELADREIEAAQGDGRLPILTGGTGLYFRALLEGLAPVPEIPAEIRQAARALHDELGGAGFHAALAKLDPAAAARLPASDTQRLIRAYEVVVATGRSLADWQQGGPVSIRHSAAAVLLLPPREALYAAIDRRVEAMVANDVLEEVRRLLAAQSATGPARAEGRGGAGVRPPHPWRAPPGCRRGGCPAGDPPLCQASNDLDPAPDAASRNAFLRSKSPRNFRKVCYRKYFHLFVSFY